MGGDDHGQSVSLSDRVQRFHQAKKVALRIHVLFPMRAHHEEALRLQAQPCEYIRLLNLVPIVLQHFKHRAAGLDHLIRRQTLSQQIISGDRAVGEVDVRRVVHDTAVDLLRHPHVEAAIASLHMKGRDLAALRRDHGQAAVGVPQDQHRVRLHLRQHLVHGNDDLADGLRSRGARSVQKVIGLAYAQIVKKI